MGRPALVAALAGVGLALLSWPVPGALLAVEGRPVAWLPLSEGERLEMTWVHSVSGIPVREVFRYREGELLLVESHNPWFAAGLGEVPGRGRLVAEEGHAVALVGIDEPAWEMVFRLGAPDVDHTLWHRGRALRLSRCFPHQRFSWSPARRPWLLARFPTKDPCL